MSKKHLGWALALALTGCVSVQIAPPAPKKASNHQFQEPSSPFRSIKSSGFDQVWKSSRTGNSLAYSSDCGSSTDLPLRTLEGESLSALSNSKVLDSKESSFSDRESLETTAEGNVDGVPVKMRVLMFKKNGCSYVFSFVGRRSVFDSELRYFENFKSNFKVP